MDHHAVAPSSVQGVHNAAALVPTATLPLFPKQGHAKGMQHRFNSIVQFLTPKQAGGVVALTATCRATLSAGSSAHASSSCQLSCL